MHNGTVLGCAALHYMLENADVTRTNPICRFDAAIVGPDGQINIIENARTFGLRQLNRRRQKQ